MIKLRVMAVALVLAATSACDSKKEAEPKKKESAAPTTINEADLFTGSSVTLPTPVAKLKLGMTEAAAKAAAPEIFAAQYGYDVPNTKVKYESVKAHVQIEKDRVWVIRLELLESQADVDAWLSKKWGPPIATKDSIGTPVFTWNAPAAGLRAKLEKIATASQVIFTAEIPRGSLLGTDPKHFAFDNPPLIGASQADAVKTLAQFQLYPPYVDANDPGRYVIPFIPTESQDDIGDSLDLRIKNGKVVGYTLEYGGDAKDTDALAAKLDSVFGAGKLDEYKTYTDYPGAPKAKAELRRDNGYQSAVWVGDHDK